MDLNWNEIKSRALFFSKTWGAASNEDSLAKPFWIGFFEIFGITNKRSWPGFAGEARRSASNTAPPSNKPPKACSTPAPNFPARHWPTCDPLTMPPALLKAHQKPDTAVDAAYQPSGGKKSYVSDAERVAFLFGLYLRITKLMPAA
jgi:hypothetical protein